MDKKPLVGIVIGSASDQEIIKETTGILDFFAIPYELLISSAHRSPEKTSSFARKAEQRGIKVIIAGAGYAAHLAGVIAAHTVLPVIGIPIDSSSLLGMDSLLSMVQMPGGVPVATVTIGKTGAKNAAILAAQILALSDPEISRKIKSYKQDLKKVSPRK